MNMIEPAQFITEALRGTLRSNVAMSHHTSWRAGGYAERVYQPADLADLIIFLRTLPAGEPVVAIGLGSNLLVRDGGLRGTVLLLHAALTEMRIEADGSVYAQAGVSGAKLARFAAKHNLNGAEFFAGIPGTLGGMLAMNAGCYGSETWNVVKNAQTLMRSGKLLERAPDHYEISYRHVVLRKQVKYFEHDDASLSDLLPVHHEEFFVGAKLHLLTGDGEIARREIKSLLSKRIASQPLNLPNAGSVFRNPPNDYAARLIEQCELKGLQIGGARVSEKHANFIVNVGGATAEDIENLINKVQTSVQQKTGVCLHPEVRIIGEYANTHE
ncbi:UDP-N-acetylenolpyruvoylglucosamine reductase [Candidatus Nitrotoga sp. HW29]|uniref:UDP-N-acetylmuramate dehydrogenase n=1 Tax=Candidatus Nitrotoga sp. HW29 TaxID=2886963 RepID=UPI001EF27132|nr:UDP-N-acetylmuramate dehydrogenase [Candidatus Nitrotoga sp. HW29]CAH1904401.1 UDP-N-acetylenolpyruvoylglucosamine reductase [Candidatus Nitrotoga sp. HW29]